MLFQVKIKYQYPYDTYGRVNTMSLDELYIVDAEIQRQSIAKTESFIQDKNKDKTIEVIEVDALKIQTGQTGVFIDGYIT